MSRLRYLSLAALLLAAVACADAQSYSALWKQHSEAQKSDLPRQQLAALDKIAAKAEAARDYGQLYKALILQAQTLADIAPDSLAPATRRIEARKAAQTDSVARAVLAAVLYRMAAERRNPWAAANAKSARLDSLRAEAMGQARRLADAQQSGYEPLVVDGTNSRAVFGGDMLSVVGYEVGGFEAMHREYTRRGNRAAACVSALEMVKQRRGNIRSIRTSPYMASLDSLAEIYGDLPVCGEVALARYDYMADCADATAGDKIAYIHRALGRWGAWKPIERLRYEEKCLCMKRFSARAASNVVAQGQRQTLYLDDIRAIDRLQLRIDGRKIWATMRFDGHPDYQLFRDSLTIPALPLGKHTLELIAPGIAEVAKMDYYVTDLYAMAIALPGGNTRIVVVDRTTGKGVAGAKLRFTPAYGKGAEKVMTADKNGEIVCSTDRAKNSRMQPFTDTDTACPDSRLYTSLSYSTDGAKGEKVQVMTDRRIYRPGQTVRVALVAYDQTGDAEYSAQEGKEISVILRDANYQEAGRTTVRTDAYGHASCDFALPTATLTGIFTIDAGRGARQTIRVEQYKRPTFAVEMPQVDEHYAMGDTLTLEGSAKSFAGVAVQGAKVRYTVNRRAGMRWNYFGGLQMQSTQIYQSETTTDGAGAFRVHVPLTVEKGFEKQLFAFDVDVDVADQGGETQHATATIPLGGRSVMLTSDIVGKQLADSLRSLTFRLYNTAGIDIDAQVSYSIDNGQMKTIHTRKAAALAPLPSGVHKLLAICEGDTLRQTFTVFRADDTRAPERTHEWMWQSAKDFPADGTPVTVQVGTSDNDTYIYYSYIAGSKLIDSGIAHVSDSLLNTRWTYRDDFNDGLLLCYAWVKDGKRYGTQRIMLRKPLADKRLRMRWTSFRDRLTPGDKETWTMHIDTPDGRPADAAVVATVYDKSLDMLAAHSLSLDVWQRRGATYGGWSSAFFPGLDAEGSATIQPSGAPVFAPSRFDSSLFPAMLYNMAYGRGIGRPGLLMKQAANISEAKSTLAADMVLADRTAGAVQEESAQDGETDTATSRTPRSDESAGETIVREKLEETAAFFPSLTTDKDGNVGLSFTLPESVTTWRCMAIANNKGMDCGLLEGEAVASKPVMAQPNMPRFLREGDKATIQCRLANTTHSPLAGTATMELIDPATDKTVLQVSKPFTLAADTTIAVAFDYTAAADCQLLICRISAKGDGFADGEQHYLPILPARERITIAKPIAVGAKGKLSLDLRDISNHPGTTFTIEYAANPAWLAVQALPAMATPRNENAIALATALYANTLGKHIANANPQLQHLDRAEADKLSALQKNDELRDIALDETPWVAEAKSEADQKTRLADFFDTNTIDLRNADLAKRLAALQHDDGAWGWWKGMEPSTHITMSIAQTLTRLQALTGTKAADDMLQKAMKWLDADMERQVAQWKADEKKGRKIAFDGGTPIDYLYIYSVAGRKANAATGYILAHTNTTPADIYRKAQMATILQWAGQQAKAKQTVQSLVEFSVYRPEMGRYYDTRRAAYSWRSYQLPTVVAAVEAIRTITPADKQTAQQMCQWLVAQKHSQMWDDDMASADAVYALMAAAPVKAAAAAKVAIDGKAIDAKATMAMGYVKTTATAPARRLTIDHSATTTGIGAVYAQYMGKPEADADCGELSVRREVSGDMRIGGRVSVKITITAKRDLDFVEVCDRRAACMESRKQLSHYSQGAYCTPKDNATYYYFNKMTKGTHVLTTEYYIDRAGTYSSGSCRVQCAYAPEFTAFSKGATIEVPQPNNQ